MTRRRGQRAKRMKRPGSSARKTAWATDRQDFIFEVGQGIRRRGEVVAHLAFLFRFPDIDPVGVIAQGSTDTTHWSHVIRQATRTERVDLVVMNSEAWGMAFTPDSAGAEAAAFASSYKAAGGSFEELPERVELLVCTAVRKDGLSRMVSCEVTDLEDVTDMGWSREMGGTLSEVF
jgi:hypothetical protein